MFLCVVLLARFMRVKKYIFINTNMWYEGTAQHEKINLQYLWKYLRYVSWNLPQDKPESFETLYRGVSFRGAAEGFRGAVCLLGADHNQQRTSGLEMPARIHRNLWLYHRAIHRVTRTFYRWGNLNLTGKFCDELCRCLELLRITDFLFFSTGQLW